MITNLELLLLLITLFLLSAGVSKEFLTSMQSTRCIVMLNLQLIEKANVSEALIIMKNTGILMFANIISKIFDGVFLILIARYLGAEKFGQISIALAFSFILAVLGDLGVKQFAVREISRDFSKTDVFISNLASFKLIALSVGFAIISTISFLLDYPKDVLVVILLINLSMALNVFTELFYGVFQAHEKLEFQAIGRIMYSALLVLGAILVVSMQSSIIFIASVYVVVSVIVFFYSLTAYVLKFGKMAVDFDLLFLHNTLKHAIPFGMTTIFVTVYYWLDSLLLSIFKDDEAVGLYNAAYRLALVILFIPATLNTSIFPAMSRYYVSSHKQLFTAFEKYLKYMALIGLPISVSITILSDKIIQLIYGKQYESSVIVLKIIIWSSFFIFLSGAFGRLFEATNRQIIITKVTFISMLVNIGANLVLIPRFSYIGASLTTVVTEFTALILGYVYLKKKKYRFSQKLVIAFSKIFAANIILAFLLLLINNLPIYAIFLIAMISYFATILLLKVLDEEEMKYVIQIMKPRFKIKKWPF